MSEMSDIIKASLDSIKPFTDMETIVGSAINTPSGVTVIPVSKVMVGFAGGGIDYGAKKLTQTQNFGGGSGTGISVTPVAFLTVGADASVNLISVDESTGGFDKLVSLIENAPQIIEKIKNTLS